MRLPVRTDGKIEIRPSMLEGSADCALRAACNAWPESFEAKGFKVQEDVKRAPAGVGNGVHEFVSHTLKTFLESGSSPNIKEALDKAQERYMEDARQFVPIKSYDDQTRSLDEGVEQVRRLSNLYQNEVGYKVLPEMVEERLEANFGDNGVITGQPDHTLKTKFLIDIKTGQRKKFHPLQIGGYVSLLKAHKRPMLRAFTVWLKRVRIDRPLEKPVTTPYKVDDCENSALIQANRVIAYRNLFEKTGDPMVAYPTNVSSNLCTPKYCRAYGTKICSMWKLKEGA